MRQAAEIAVDNNDTELLTWFLNNVQASLGDWAEWTLCYAATHCNVFMVGVCLANGVKFSLHHNYLDTGHTEITAKVVGALLRQRNGEMLLYLKDAFPDGSSFRVFKSLFECWMLDMRYELPTIEAVKLLSRLQLLGSAAECIEAYVSEESVSLECKQHLMRWQMLLLIAHSVVAMAA
ncbi:hypothetical protein PLESTB_000876000 [Pleodorina starrii]|uniref:Uncharacterized protein n=1 Tax=Pleodorina starrii TaxID=330485 RepID=A0A9W6F3P4_9CHLO|nr:hypothetical protein PLESTB_000876000 [Pleodorina starrii]